MYQRVWPRIFAALKTRPRLSDAVELAVAVIAFALCADIIGTPSGLIHWSPRASSALASLALRNAETFAERSHQARVQRGFHRIASLLGEPLSLVETYDAAAQAAHPDINFVFLNQAEAPADVTRFLAQHAPALRNVLLDPAGEASRSTSNRGLPATLFLDTQGRLAGLRVGELSAASLAQRLDALRQAGKE